MCWLKNAGSACTKEGLLQAVDTAAAMHQNGGFGDVVPDYMGELGVGSGGEGDSGLYGGCEPDGLEEVKGNAQGFADGESIRIFNIVP